METAKETLDRKMGMRDYFSMPQESQIIAAMEDYVMQKASKISINNPVSGQVLPTGLEVRAELRAILSHALLADEGGDKIAKDNFDLMVEGCFEFAEKLVGKTFR